MDRMTAGACTCILCRQLLPRWLSWSQIRHESDVQSYCKLHGWRTEDDIWLTRHCASRIFPHKIPVQSSMEFV